METPNREDQLRAHVHSALEAWSKGDTEGYGRAAGPDITYFHNVPAGPRVDGIDAYRAFLKSLKGLIPPHDYEVIDPKLQMYGDVGVFTLIYRAFSPDGDTLAQARGTSVYREVDGEWESVHCHWSVFDESGEPES